MEDANRLLTKLLPGLQLSDIMSRCVHRNVRVNDFNGTFTKMSKGNCRKLRAEVDVLEFILGQ